MRNSLLRNSAAALLFAAAIAPAIAETPEQKGFAIAARADRSDRGFTDSRVEMKMVLRNAAGQEASRTLALNTLEVPDEQLGDKTLIVFDSPADIDGTALLSHAKILDADDQRLYLPALKRIKRISSVNKSGPFVGSEFAFEDFTALELNKYTYKYLREEPCGDMTCDVVERKPRYEHWGRIDLFVLPGFRERPFPRTEGRLRAGLIVEEDLASFESGAGNKHIDVAGRYSHFIGDWDFGVSIFHGLSREPRLLPNATGTALAPRYDEITQLGVDVQYTLDAWLWKFEGIAREGHGDSFAAMVGGVEYTFYQVADSDADVGVLAEINLDGRDENRAPPTPLEHDLFLGARLALNDVDDTQALAGAVIDAEDGTLSFFLEAERRIGDSWKIEAEARLLGNVDDKNVLAPFKRDSFLNLRLSRFF